MNEADAKAQVESDHKVFSAYRREWVRVRDAEGHYERNGKRVEMEDNPELDNYKLGMATKLNQRINLTCPTNTGVIQNLEDNLELGLPVVVRNSGRGGTVFICGNGRGLPDHVKVIKQHGMHDNAHVWGCNGAANWLWHNDIKLTHAFTTDTSHRMYEECWKDPPPAHYLIATCVQRRTIDHVMAAGNKVTIFHNFTGLPGELERQKLYPTAPLVGEGLNSVNRALALAQAMNFKKIYILGAVGHLDPKSKTHHADGQSSNQQYTLKARIYGRDYATHADLLYSGIDLILQERLTNGTLCKADYQKLPPGRKTKYERQDDGTYLPKGREKKIEIVGNKRDLGMILRQKPKEWLDRCIQFGA